MVKIEIDKEKCIGCGLCVTTKVCPFNLFIISGDDVKVKAEVGECMLCGECEKACPVGAIKVVKDGNKKG